MSASVPGAVGGLYDVGENLDARLPDCPPEQAWARRRDEYRLVNPANRRKLTVIVVGTGLAGAGAAATLGRLGYRVECFSLHDAPRRAHSVAAQGGINAARARKVDGDSLARFVKDTVKGGDYRGREADVVRLGLESGRVIDHMEAIGAPFAREYGGQLATRSFGGVQVSRTYYTRGQTGQQLEIACAQALQEQVAAGSVRMHTRTEMLDLIVADSRAQGIVTRDLLSGEVQAHTAHAVVLATGGYGSVYHYSTLAMASNATATWRAHRRGAAFASACMVQFHPTALPVSSHWQSKTTLMSESLRNDGRIWVPVRPGDERAPNEIPEDERDYYLERKYPAFGNLTPRDVASRNAREQIESGRGVGPLRNSVYLDFRDALERLGKETIASRYGNLFEMYLDATGEDPYEVPMRIAPGAHFTMGGLWVDFDQMSTIPGLFVGGEASNNYHGANRLGANSLLSASVDGWFVLPLAVPNYLAGLVGSRPLSPDAPEALQAVADTRERIEALMAVAGPTVRCGSTAGWVRSSTPAAGSAAPRQGCCAPWRRCAPCARSSGPMSPWSVARRGSTRSWRRRCGSPTSWSWPRSWSSTPWTGASPPAPTSVRSTRPRAARPSAMTRPGARCRPGRRGTMAGTRAAPSR